MLHEKFTALLRSGLRNVARLDYDHPKKVILALLALSSTLVLGAAPSVIEWVNYPCGGTIYDGDACYPQLADIAGPLNGKMHATRAFLFDHFAAEPWPRKAEVIVEPAHRCLRCPSPIMDCVLEHEFDVCWEADGTSHAPDASSLEPLPLSALDALVEMQRTLTELSVADLCWKDVPALGCHPANVSSSEFGAAVGAPAKAVWVPLELSGPSLASSLQTSFGGADGTLPPALKYSFFLTGVTDPVHEGDFPSKYSRGAFELENSFHVAMKEIQARAAALPPSSPAPAHHHAPPRPTGGAPRARALVDHAVAADDRVCDGALPSDADVSARRVLRPRHRRPPRVHHGGRRRQARTASHEGGTRRPGALHRRRQPERDGVLRAVLPPLPVHLHGAHLRRVDRPRHRHRRDARHELVRRAIRRSSVRFSDDPLHHLRRYLRRPLEKGSDPREAFIERFAAGAVAVTFTSISTAIAFLATAVSVFQMAYEIGICCALGVG